MEREFWNSKSTASQVAMYKENSKKALAIISKPPFLGIICRLFGANGVDFHVVKCQDFYITAPWNKFAE